MQNACYDVPSELDWKYSDIIGAETPLPDEFVIDRLSDYQNQGLEAITKFMCVFYSTTHGCNILNELEGVGEEAYSAKEFGLEAIRLGLLDPKSGAAIQSGPKLARDQKKISGWFLVDENTIKQAIYSGHPVVVGSNQFDFSENVIKLKNGYGHAILIIGWNKDGYIIKESYGKERWDKGRQYLPYNLFNNLFPSKYALIDQENPIITYRKKIMDSLPTQELKQAFTNGFFNGKDIDKTATRGEVATMVERAYEKLILELKK